MGERSQGQTSKARSVAGWKDGVRPWARGGLLREQRSERPTATRRQARCGGKDARLRCGRRYSHVCLP